MSFENEVSGAFAHERRAQPRVSLQREIRVHGLGTLKTLMGRDISEGGLFLEGCKALVGDPLEVDFVVEELKKLRLRARVTVVRSTPTGVGVRFDSFQEGQSELARLVQFLMNPAARKDVLVVDDSATSLFVVRTMLNPLQALRVTESDGGEKALKVLEERTCDLIVTDLEMPGVDGFEFIERVRRHPHLANTPVVIMTARDDDKDLERAFSLGVTGFLKKPLKAPELIYSVCRPLSVNPAADLAAAR